MNEIKKETDYSKFKFTDKNRSIDPKKLERFSSESKVNPHLMESCPILVNSEMEIIDGQHRFLACKNSGLPIYYIQDCRLSYQDIVTLNKDQKNWLIADYINHHVSLRNINFLKFVQFVKKTGLSQSMAFCFLGFNRRNLVSSVKKGNLIFPSESIENLAIKKASLSRKFQENIFSKGINAHHKLVFSYSFFESVAMLPQETDIERFFENLFQNYEKINASRGFLGYHFQYKCLGMM